MGIHSLLGDLSGQGADQLTYKSRMAPELAAIAISFEFRATWSRLIEKFPPLPER